MENVNDFIMNTLYQNLDEKSIADIANKNIVFLGSNLLGKFDQLLRRIITCNPYFKGMIIASEFQRKHVENEWPDKLEVILWKGSYDVSILENQYVKEHLKGGTLVFCGSNSVNYRDMNILEIGVEASAQLGSSMVIYDYNQERLFQYANLDLMMRGMKLYTEINEYIYESRKVFNI